MLTAFSIKDWELIISWDIGMDTEHLGGHTYGSIRLL